MDTVNTTDASTRDQLLLDVLALARRYAGRVASAADADDIAQEVVLDCLTRLNAGRWHVTTSLPSFARGMVQRQRACMLRRNERDDTRNGEYARETLEHSHEWMSPEHSQEAHELTELHDQTLASLPPTCRTAYRMVREERATYRTVARRMGVGLATVHHQVVTAERQFRYRLRKEGIGVRHHQRAANHNGTAPTGLRTLTSVLRTAAQDVQQIRDFTERLLSRA